MSRGEEAPGHGQDRGSRHGQRETPGFGEGPCQRGGLARGDELAGQVGHLGAVPVPPGSRIQRQQRAQQAAVHDQAAAMRRSPISAMRADSVSRAYRNSRPAAVIWYGRRRSSAGSASTRPARSSLARAPYSVPAPSLTPAKLSMSLIRAYPCFGQSARLVRIRMLRSDEPRIESLVMGAPPDIS